MKRVALLLTLLLLFACAAAEPPEYTGLASIQMGEPQFTIDLGDADIVYLPLDDLGRVQGVSAIISASSETPEVENNIYPSGWQQTTYEFIPEHHLYHRCCLLSHRLGGSGVPDNLFTGTQYLNISGMLPVEDAVAEYLHRTGNHVRYEVIPLFRGDCLVCSGVSICAESVEDDEISIAVYCFNVQPGVAIDYTTGQSTIAGIAMTAEGSEETGTASAESNVVRQAYVVNKNTQRFHLPDCSSVDEIKEKNRWDYYGTREELIEAGYRPCKLCEP